MTSSRLNTTSILLVIQPKIFISIKAEQAIKQTFSMLILFLFLYQPLFSQDEIKIGKQVWMSQNLETTTFSNGELIIQAQSAQEWEKAFKNKQPAWCAYELDASLVESTKRSSNPVSEIPFGKLYNIYAMQDKRNVCPVGYRVPDNSDWQGLIAHLDSIRILSENDRFADMRLLKSISGWQPGESRFGGKVENSNGNNKTGFNALPTGFRGPMGNFLNAGINAVFWSKTNSPMKTNWCFNIPIEISYNSLANFTYTSVKSGLSIRCIKDTSFHSTSN